MAARGLGKGLDSLIPASSTPKKNTNEAKKSGEEKNEVKDGVTLVKITKVEPNRDQPRKKFDEDKKRIIDNICNSVEHYSTN